jgi:hypothetical protein
VDEYGWEIKTLFLDGWQMMTKYKIVIHHQRSADIESLMSCVLFYVWVLFVCLQVSVFVVCSSMEWRECVCFSDEAGSFLHGGWYLWGM